MLIIIIIHLLLFIIFNHTNEIIVWPFVDIVGVFQYFFLLPGGLILLEVAMTLPVL